MSRGQWAEEWIEHRCRRLNASGEAFIRRVTPPAKLVSGPLGPRAFFQGSGLPDFVGFLCGGRGILFDVKSTRKKSWGWAEGKNLRTKARQTLDLERAGEVFGVVAGLLIGFMPSQGEYPTWAWVPWRLLHRVGAGNWTPEDLKEIGAAVWQERPGKDDAAMLTNMVGTDARTPTR